MGGKRFTWGDCIALVENTPHNDPLAQAIQGDDWAWHDPSRDVLVAIMDILKQINVKTPRPEGLSATRIPKPTSRPWEKVKQKTPVNANSGMDWDDAAAWMKARQAA